MIPTRRRIFPSTAAPAGLDAGEIAWPLPRKIPIGTLANYGYEGTVLLPVSGVGMLHMHFNGFETAPRYVQVMMGLYVVMTALFIRIQALMLPELRTAVTAQDWPAGAAVLGKIRRLVGINLIVGLVLVAIAAARPMF